jgi:hypothetical protein
VEAPKGKGGGARQDMMIPRSIGDIERMIQDQIQENIHLDYEAQRCNSE